jgi:putative transposase
MKYRKKLLNNDIANFLKNIFSEIGDRYSFEFDAIGCDGDHVHLFVGAEPKKFSFKSDADYKKHNSKRNFQRIPWN